MLETSSPPPEIESDDSWVMVLESAHDFYENIAERGDTDASEKKVSTSIIPSLLLNSSSSSGTKKHDPSDPNNPTNVFFNRVTYDVRQDIFSFLPLKDALALRYSSFGWAMVDQRVWSGVAAALRDVRHDERRARALDYLKGAGVMAGGAVGAVAAAGMGLGILIATRGVLAEFAIPFSYALGSAAVQWSGTGLKRIQEARARPTFPLDHHLLNEDGSACVNENVRAQSTNSSDSSESSNSDDDNDASHLRLLQVQARSTSNDRHCIENFIQRAIRWNVERSNFDVLPAQSSSAQPASQELSESTDTIIVVERQRYNPLAIFRTSTARNDPSTPDREKFWAAEYLTRLDPPAWECPQLGVFFRRAVAQSSPDMSDSSALVGTVIDAALSALDSSTTSEAHCKSQEAGNGSHSKGPNWEWVDSSWSLYTPPGEQHETTGDDTSDRHDEAGWRYGISFATKGKRKESSLDMVRQRLWARRIQYHYVVS